MKRLGFVYVLILSIVASVAASSLAQVPTLESNSRAQFNQVFVKVIVPVTTRTPKQSGRVVESWVAEQLKELGEGECFAVTDWVPVCDGLLEDKQVNNRVWDGRLGDKYPFCPIGGDIPKRENGRVLVNLAGWTPSGGEANILLSDEPGSRAVGPVRLHSRKEEKRSKIEEGCRMWP